MHPWQLYPYVLFSFLNLTHAPLAFVQLAKLKQQTKPTLKKLLLFPWKEIRQEAVKAALASYAENQGAVNSSKRNTAYLLPLNNAPPVLAKEEDTNSPELANRSDHPFPVGHIIGNKAVTCAGSS